MGAQMEGLRVRIEADVRMADEGGRECEAVKRALQALQESETRQKASLDVLQVRQWYNLY